jgi:hypothetical protein
MSGWAITGRERKFSARVCPNFWQNRCILRINLLSWIFRLNLREKVSSALSSQPLKLIR